MIAARRLTIPLVLASGFALAACLSGLAFVYFEHRNTERLREISAKLELIDSVRLPVRNADRLMYGYLLTANEAYLSHFEQSLSAIRPAFERFSEKFSDPSERELVQQMRSSIEHRIEAWSTFLEQKDSPAMRDLIRAIDPEAIARNTDSLNELEANLKALHQETDAARNTIRNILFGLLLLIAIVVCALCVATIVAVLRSSRERDRAFHAMEATKSSLERTVAERTDKLVQANTETQRTLRVLYNTIDSMADAVIVSDSTGRIILANQKAHAVLSPLDSFDTERWDDFYELTQPDGTTPVPRQERPLARALNGEELDNCQLLLRKKGSAKSIALHVTTRAIRNGNSGAEGIIAVYRDVTAIQETERQLRYAQKMEAIGQLTGGIAHDFNNILTVILGTIGMLQEAVADRPELEEVASMIDEAAGRGADLTQELLSFARKQPLQPQAVDVPALLSSTVKLLKPTIGEHIDINLALNDTVLPALVDPTQLTTAILNLAVNARDAMPNGGPITIEAEDVVIGDEQIAGMPDLKPGAYVAITVTDSGEGMPPAVRERIFEPFFTTKDVGRGTGLGLAMVYGFVKQSQGHIQVYSEVGYGTSFKLLLPSTNMAAIAVEDACDESLPTGTESILIVEDDRLVGDYVKRQLVTLGYRISHAETARDALKLIADGEHFDLMMTDIVLPGNMNGRELAQQVVRLRPDIRVFYTSGYSRDAIIHQGRLDSDIVLLNKPYRKEKLAQVLRQVLDARTPPLALSA
jgi:signal transduction histidine kinase/CheY-like chemotaxis protein/CHASE3 domain sensor protein